MVFKDAPEESLTIPKSIKPNAVFTAGIFVLVSVLKPETEIPYNLPFVKPALSTSVPFLVLFPI